MRQPFIPPVVSDPECLARALFRKPPALKPERPNTLYGAKVPRMGVHHR